VAAGRVLSHLSSEVVSFEEINVKFLRKSEWTLSDLVDWLLGGHIHFITCHPHMHTDSFGWTIADIYNELQRLRYHCGFPSSDALNCPIWSQDKYRYLSALPAEHVLPTFRLELNRDANFEEIKTSIEG